MLQKYEGLKIFWKTQREVEANEPKFFLPMVTNFQGQRSLTLFFGQKTYLVAPGNICNLAKNWDCQKMHPLIGNISLKFQIFKSTHQWAAEIWKMAFES